MIRILTLPFNPESEAFDDEPVTRFLVNKRVRRLEPQFFQTNGRAYWTVLIEYEPVLTAAEVTQAKDQPALDETQQALLRRLRAWRRERADRDGLPVFLVATNRQLTTVAERQPRTLEALRQIDGFGKKKVERYGKDIITVVATADQPPNPPAGAVAP